MPDAAFLRDRQQQVALKGLQRKLQQEQLAFDPGDPQYDDYQTQLDALETKQTNLKAARDSARQSKL